MAANKKKKKNEILFESEEDIFRRINDRKEADTYIVSPSYRIENCSQGIWLASQIPDYPGVRELKEEFIEEKKRAETEKNEKALALARRHFEDAGTEDEYKKVQDECAALGGYGDSKELEDEAAARVRAYKKKTTRGRVLWLAIVIAIAAAVVWVASSGLVGYGIAWAEGKAGYYLSARNRFEKMGDFLDARRLTEYYDLKLTEEQRSKDEIKLEDASAGDTVNFGNFSWMVADVDGTQLTLVLKTIKKADIFGSASYNTLSKDTTWESSSLREYLNTTVLESFTPEEREAMVLQKHTPCSNTVYGTDGGNGTEDYIRIPDTQEARQYISDGLFSAPGADVWLCTPGHDMTTAAFMTKGGRIVEYGDGVTDNLGVLAVIVVDYSKTGQ